MKSWFFLLSCCSFPLCAGAPAKKATPPKKEVQPSLDELAAERNRICLQCSPCKRVSYEFYGQFLYLQPNGSNLYYAAEAFPFDTAISVPASSPNWQIFEINPSYVPGFDIGFKTIFSDANASLILNWERLYTTNTESMKVKNTGDMTGPIFDIGPNSTNYANGTGTLSFQFDEADLLFGKSVCLLDRLFLNLYGGASFARIKQTMATYYTNGDGSVARSITSPSTFMGAGTNFGLNFSYEMCKNFFFTGSSGIGLFMGQLTNSNTYQSYTPFLPSHNLPQPNVQQTDVPNRTQVIPGLQEKLGFAYAYMFNPCTKLSIEAGYQLQTYLNAIQNIEMTAPQVLPSLFPGGTVDAGMYAVGFKRTLSDFILTGLYVSASVGF